MLQIDDILPEIISFRRKLHAFPESAGKEFTTCAAIREALAKIDGVEILPPFLETDTVAFIHGGKGAGKNVTLRADIDALPVTEPDGVEFKSTVPGMMHACGHDVHSAILLGAAEILAARRDEFAGSVRLVFQPGEENLAMAKDLIAAGALDVPAADFTSALHCEPGMEVGAIGLRDGAMMSSCQHFRVTFRGQGGHGSRPHKARNPLPAACAAVLELQSVVTNRINTQNPAVLSICSIHSGELDNVIPEEAYFVGTLRALDDQTAEELASGLEEVCQAVARIYRVECETHIARGGYPATVNSKSGADLARKVLAEAGIKCIEMPESNMASEDFSYFLKKAGDGVMVKLGVGEGCAALHNSNFAPDERAIPYGIKYMTGIALAALK